MYQHEVEEKKKESPKKVRDGGKRASKQPRFARTGMFVCIQDSNSVDCLYVELDLDKIF